MGSLIAAGAYVVGLLVWRALADKNPILRLAAALGGTLATGAVGFFMIRYHP